MAFHLEKIYIKKEPFNGSTPLITGNGIRENRNGENVH